MWNFKFFLCDSDSEEGDISFLQIMVVFEIKKNESKRKHWVSEFFHKQEEKDHSTI